jgi:hypothetical protein
MAGKLLRLSLGIWIIKNSVDAFSDSTEEDQDLSLCCSASESD